MTQSIKVAIAGGTIAALALFALTPLASAAVATDKDDYSPGETVTISGDGYWSGETVSIDVTAPYGSESGTATANSGGEFSWSFVLPSDESALGDYTYAATGLDSGIAQSGTFTDATISSAPIDTYSDAGHTTPSSAFTQNDTVYASTTVTITGGGPNPDLRIQWLNGSGTMVQETLFSGVGNNTQHSDSLNATTTGTWTVRTCKTSQCTGANLADSQSFSVAGPGTLRVRKEVTNDNGGTATSSAFTLHVKDSSNNEVTGSPFAGSVGGAVFTLSPDTYTISEDALAGYAQTNLSCVDSGGASVAHPVVLASNQTVICTVTNDDQPASLTLVKVVVNDNGGSATTTDWTLTATGPTGFSGFGPTVTNNDVDAGTYDLSENGPAGYTASNWVCTGGNQLDGDTVEIGPGEKVICTITNDDVAVSPPVGSSCAPAVVSGITITICNSGTITSTTTAEAHTGTNVALGSAGGGGGNGGNVDPAGDENNGGASAGNGGNGGNGGAGGFIQSGDATSDAGSLNGLNRTEAEVGRDCDCGDINGMTVSIVVDNDPAPPAENSITNLTRARARSGDNVGGGSGGGNGGAGGSVDGGAGNENNGGASAGNGGAGGGSAIGGTIQTGTASSSASSVNVLNFTRIHVRF